MQAEFPDLFAREGRIKYHIIHARLHERTVTKQQKGRRAPIQLQEPVKREINRLLQEGQNMFKYRTSKRMSSYSPQR